MKPFFISVPTKLLMLIIGILLVVSTGFSLVSLSRLNQDVIEFQAHTLVQGQAQYKIHRNILRTQLRTWVESFADIVNLKEQDDFQQLSSGLAEQFEGLQLNYNVQNIWLFNGVDSLHTEDNDLSLLSSGNVPEYVKKNVKKAFSMQEPNGELYCHLECEQLVTIPLLNQQGQLAVVAITASLVDILYSIKATLQNEVAIISLPSGNDMKVEEAHFISSSDMRLTKALFLEGEMNESIEQIKSVGLQIDRHDKNYLANLMLLTEEKGQSFYLVLIDDISEFKIKNNKEREQFILSMIVIFSCLGVLIYYVSNPLTQRLIVLSNLLPLLASKQFEKFREIKVKKRHFFNDELDILATSAQDLSYELEELNIEVEQKTKELENIAMYDLLTGLPNRNMLNYQLGKSVANLTRYQKKVAVLFLDLDDFKKVNDSHGHGDGDRLLIEAANRVRLSIRNVDLACRFGGDEFVVVLGQIDSIDDAIAVAEEILLLFKVPIKIGSSLFYVSTSIGIAYSDDVSVKADDLISNADIAMYEAKDNGGAQYHIYSPAMYQRVAHRVMLEGEVRQALEKNQFSLSLQPQLEAKTKKLYGFEALLRWEHPEKGMISPDDFIPILENSAYMIELGYWIIRRCFELAKSIKHYGLTDVRMAINLSAWQFMDPNLPKFLEELLIEFSLSAEDFDLELTEQTLVKDIEHAIEIMNALKELGFTFAIDDFGTGYSSLAYLKKMPVDVIKIDKSFIFGMLENNADYQIIISTIAMVKSLELKVIAEGVETGAQLRSLSENDCDIIQGYYFSKPIPEKELFEFIRMKVVDGYWKTHAL